MKKNILKKLLKSLGKFILSLTGKVVPLIYYSIIISTVLGIGGTFFSISYMKSPGPLKEPVNIYIPPGTPTIGIAKLLGENNVIEMPDLFAFIVKVSQSGKTMKAGEYSFSEGISPIEIIRKVQAGDVVIRKITIPEGLMTFQALEIIKNDEALKGDIPDGIADGELLPETYDYHYGESRAEIVKRMQEDMRKTIDELWEKRQPGLPLQTKQEALTLASIIEKETGVAEERKRVAAVFINRLKMGMRLQTDPTVIYAITKGKALLGRPLTHDDLEIDSNYNTYKVAGLPPTPIANPGRAAIEAALNPLTTDEIYFVASGNGGHLFSSNLKQHNENVTKLRHVEHEQQKNNTDKKTDKNEGD